MVKFPYDERGDSPALQLHYAARGLMDTGEYAEAAALLEASTKLDTHYKTIELLGECLWQMGRLRDAVLPLAAATTLNRQPRAPALLAQIFLELGDVRQAREMAELALERNPGSKTMQDFLTDLPETPQIH